MRFRLTTACIVALAAIGCTVGSNDPFVPADSGSASAGATASGSATSGMPGGGSGDTGGTDAPTSGAEGGSGSSSGTGTSGWDPGGEGSTTSSTSSTTSSETSSSGGSEGSSESTGGPADECGGQPLDPQLATPPVCEPTCTGIGFGFDCPLAEYCRLRDSETAVCEGCDACGNLHAPCVTTADCDIIFTCFMGQCTAQCDLDTPQTCGNPAACTDVGHPTHGVCDPNL